MTIDELFRLKNYDQLRADLAALRQLLQDFADLHSAPCRYDHHGNCQEHYLGKPCIIADAREVLKRIPPGE
jgi:hypothetical protein